MSSHNNNCTICLENNKIQHTKWNDDGNHTYICVECCKKPACVECEKNKKIRYNYWDDDNCATHLCDDCFKDQLNVHVCTYCDIEKTIIYTNLNLNNDDPIIRLCKECWNMGKDDK